jgi:FAD dependent oxidoreductase
MLSVEAIASMAAEKRMDAFVLAAGLGLAALHDIDSVIGRGAGLTAGLGLTIRMPLAGLPLDHVLMDADDFTYLIPQRSQIVRGGTNIPTPHDDELVEGKSTVAKRLRAEWEDDVRRRVRRLYPEIGPFTGGDVRVGARPLRHEVLTALTERFGIPGLILGGAGGSGWTFSVGIADDACTFLSEHLDASAPGQLQLQAT